jgi:hypothetical protein
LAEQADGMMAKQEPFATYEKIINFSKSKSFKCLKLVAKNTHRYQRIQRPVDICRKTFSSSDTHAENTNLNKPLC